MPLSRVPSYRRENLIKRWTRGLSRNHSFHKSLDVLALSGRFFGQNVLDFFGNRNRYFHIVCSVLKWPRPSASLFDNINTLSLSNGRSGSARQFGSRSSRVTWIKSSSLS